MPRKSNHFLLSLLIGTCILLSQAGCRKENTRTYTLLIPIYKAKNEVLAAINGNPNQSVETAGKIFIKGNYIFLNEVDKGIHIIDNSKPTQPQQVAFLKIPGNQDIAVKGNILYADMYGDLLAIDISSPKNAKVSSVLPGLFKERIWYANYYAGTGQDNQIIVDWIKKDTTVNIDDDRRYYSDCMYCDYSSSLSSTTSSGTQKGLAGSMARMVMIDDYLYALTGSDSLGIIDTRNAANPGFISNWYAGFELETIYPFQNKLFLGSARGMYMYDVDDPVKPVVLGQFTHGRSCDPVVTDGEYAYVTLHTGTLCGGSQNELNIINVKKLTAPQFVKSYPMTKPSGLCKDGNFLFVCDGSSGIKIYDATNPADLKLLQQIRNSNSYDVIAGNHTAMIVTKTGLYQYDYTDVKNLRLLSFFSISAALKR